MNGEQLRDIALENFEIKNQKFLENCRQIATQLIKKNGRVSINVCLILFIFKGQILRLRFVQFRFHVLYVQDGFLSIN